MVHQRKVLHILGPTSSGKTEVALELATLIHQQTSKKPHIVSADSKQVYRGLETLTGADVPLDAHDVDDSPFPYTFLETTTAFLHGVACIDLNRAWSLGDFADLAKSVQKYAASSQVPIILVGGTGLYHQALSLPLEKKASPEEIDKLVGQDASLEELSTLELQERIKRSAPEYFQAMNHSDQNNPRRLVRALERIAAGQLVYHQFQHEFPSDEAVVVLDIDTDTLKEKILSRVEKRWHQAVEEVKHASQLIDLAQTAMSALGFQECSDFLDELITQQQAIERWVLRELQYVRRQKVWNKKIKSAHFCQPSQAVNILMHTSQL